MKHQISSSPKYTKLQSTPKLLLIILVVVLWALFLIILEHLAYNDSAQAFDVQPFQKGEIFAAVGDGKVKRLRPDGSLIAVYDTGLPGGETAGMAFDEAGNLYLTHFDGDQVYKFSDSGKSVAKFGSGYDNHPESIAIDENQNVYVGQADGSGDVLLFSPEGELLETFDIPTESRGTDWIDLAADQRTLFYTSEGKYIHRYDVKEKRALPHFNKSPLPGSIAYAFRILPDGGVIVADTEVIVRLDKKGQVKKIYDAPGEDNWFAMNIDPDGRTFWSGNIETGEVYRFDIRSGKVVSHWNTDPYVSLGGLAVFGEMRVSQPFTVTKPRIPSWVRWLVLIPVVLLGAWLVKRLRSRKSTPITQPESDIEEDGTNNNYPFTDLFREDVEEGRKSDISHGRSKFSQ